jgi:Zn-dependent alcohol dehydrogenase
LVAASPLPGVLSQNSQESVSPFHKDGHASTLISNLPEGSSVAVFGCGAIGLGVINTSVGVGASRIIAIDINPRKEAWARKFGATEFISPTNLKEGQKIQDHLVEITDGGLDYTFDCTGNVCPYPS